jgi:hypothetical protein
VNIAFLLAQPFAQHALLAAALVAVSCGLIGPFVVDIAVAVFRCPRVPSAWTAVRPSATEGSPACGSAG